MSFILPFYTPPSAAAVFVDEFKLHGTYLEATEADVLVRA